MVAPDGALLRLTLPPTIAGAIRGIAGCVLREEMLESEG
jgi:hypothetical protein